MDLNLSNKYVVKFTKLAIMTIYKHKIDIGVIRWLFLTLNFIYIISLVYPINNMK